MNTPETDPVAPWKYKDKDLVWHYTNGSALKNMLTKHELWASSTAFMNDSGERRIAIDFLKEARRDMGGKFPKTLDSYLEHIGDWNETRRFMGRFHDSSTLRFLLSGAQAGDSLTLWRGYAGTDEVSYAVGLDRRKTLNILAPEGTAPERVMDYNKISPWFDIDYSRDRAVAAAKTAVEEILHTYEKSENEATGLVIAKIEDLTEKLCNEIKHEGFMHEEEARIIARANNSLIRYRPGRFGMIPYVALTGAGDSTHPVSFKPGILPIREICISPGSNQGDAEQGLELFLESSGYGPQYYDLWNDLINPIKIKRSTIPFR